jgi:flagellar biosynthesis GTPase FlhF
VSGWLDVFIPMTGLPRARGEELRAELEDHLRARVDDLMITGLTEPEAMRRAVGELGETAALAGRFRAALKSKGVRLMHGVLVAVAGSALALGIWNASAPSGGGASPAGVAVAAVESDRPSRVVSGLRDQTFGGLFEALRGLSDKPLLVHWERLESVGIQRDTPLGLEVDALPSHVLYRLLRERTEAMVGDPVTVEESGELVEVSTRSHFDERTTGVRSYDIRDLVELKSGWSAADLARGENSEWAAAGRGVLEVVSSLADRDFWEEYGGDAASGTLSGGVLLVRAPARIHELVEGVLAMLREDAAETRRLAAEEREANNRRESERLERARQEGERFQAEQAAAQARHREAEEAARREEIARLEAELQDLTRQIAEAETELSLSFGEMSKWNTMTDEERRAESVRSSMQDYRVQDLRLQRDTVRDLVITLKYGVAPKVEGVTLEQIKGLIEESAQRTARQLNERGGN